MEKLAFSQTWLPSGKTTRYCPARGVVIVYKEVDSHRMSRLIGDLHSFDQPGIALLCPSLPSFASSRIILEPLARVSTALLLPACTSFRVPVQALWSPGYQQLTADSEQAK